jgi:hypothetical protein
MNDRRNLEEKLERIRQELMQRGMLGSLLGDSPSAGQETHT